jgi:hypothetical protein
MTADNLEAVELGLKAIIERIEVIQTIARDLQHTPVISAEDKKVSKVRGSTKAVGLTLD